MANPNTYRASIAPVPDGTPCPQWSVMIPTYNCAKYLRETLMSVLSQDPGPDAMQIEVVDDCSTKDDPEAVVQEVGRGRVTFHRQTQNVGHTRNFETCLQHSRGHLIHLLHGDDVVRPGFYSTMGSVFAGHPEIGAAFSRNLYIDEHGNWTGVSSLEAPKSGIIEDLVERLAVHQRIDTPAMVVRRQVYETLGGFDRRLSWTEDWEMWMRIAVNYPVWYEIEPLALYRNHPQSNTGVYIRTGENLRDLDRLFSMIEPYVPNQRSRLLTNQGRALHARRALLAAGEMVRQRDFSCVLAQTRAAVHLSHDFSIVLPLFRLACLIGGSGVKTLFLGKPGR